MKPKATSPQRERPIGIFDSGIGGLTVLREVNRELADEDVVYFGDTARVPYGTKSRETITKFSINNVRFLKKFRVKMVIVACNTSSALSLDILKKRFSIPIVGVIEAGAKEAMRRTRNGRIGVIGTKATIGSGSYEACLKRMDPAIRVTSQACPLFVPLVEEGWLEGDIASRVAKMYLDVMKSFKIDTLILGCTHYPLLSQVIGKVLGKHVNLVNSAEETAKEARKLLMSSKLKKSVSVREPRRSFYVSDEPEQFRILGERFLGRPIHAVVKVDPS